MSNNPVSPNPDPTTEPQGTEATPTDPEPETPAQETDWKAEARKWEQRAKQNADAATRLTEIEEASKTEAERQAERLAALEATVKEYETREQIATWKTEVAEATGVPAIALAGSTKEEIEAHAATLKPLIEAAAAVEPETPRPGVVPTIGKTPQAPHNISLDDQIAAAEADGDAVMVRQLKALKLGELSKSHTTS